MKGKIKMIKKIDGKKYADWVKDSALDELKKIAAYKTLCAENKIELQAIAEYSDVMVQLTDENRIYL